MKEKDKTIWFKRKTYGWGWVPATWQGWVVILIYIVFLFLEVKKLNIIQNSDNSTFMILAPRFIVLTALLMFICYMKGEKPKWSWGK
jgi:hypothetical protein